MASKKKIPIDEIIELHKQGYYDHEIADMLGCCRSNITIRLNKAGIHGRRSNDICSICGKRGGDLETHHIKPFSQIIHEFISNIYDGNINTIYDQLMAYEDFTNEENMIVLCSNCHHDVHYSDNPELNPYRWGSATTISKESRAQAIGARSAGEPKGS